MPLNKTKLPLTDMTPAQFQDWPHPIVNEALFPDSDIASYWRCLAGPECRRIGLGKCLPRIRRGRNHFKP